MIPRRGLTRLLIYLFLLFALVSLTFTYLRVHQQSLPTMLNLHNQDGFIITNLEIRSCSLFANEHCQPTANWYKIPKPMNYNLNGKKSSKLRQQYLFVEKLPLSAVNQDTKVISNLKIAEGESDERWQFDLVPYNSEQPDSYIYNIDLLFGVDAVDPRPDWMLIMTPLLGITGQIPVYITVKSEPVTVIEKPKLSIEAGTHYKILQAADLHFSTGEGVCRDQFPEVPDCKADKRTLKFLETVLDLEKPDLVILTGDQVFGDDSFDSITTILKVLTPFINRKIPYAVMLGNHDDEGSVSREDLMSFVESLPWSLAQVGPSNVDGYGNYVFAVKEKEKKTNLLTFYVLDSHKYSLMPKTNPGYDWLKENQLLFVQRQHETIVNTHENHISFALFHIPLPEYRNINQPLIGNYKEGITAPKYNTYARDLFAKIGVSIVTVGHDHCNDYCLLDTNTKENNKLWLCYGGGAGEGGYGGYGGTTRRLRLFDVDTSEGTVKTYKRLETQPQEIFDEQVLVRNKEVVNQ